MSASADMTTQRPSGRHMVHVSSLSSADTSADALQVRLDILRRMTFARKAELISELSETLRVGMIAGVVFRHPEYTPAQARWAVVRHLLGDELFVAAFPDAPCVSL